MAEFIWQKSYPEVVDKEIGPIQHKSLSALFEDACKQYSDRVAFENMGAQLTFRQVDELATNFAAFLQQKLGMKKGERIAIQMPNLLQFPIAFIGALKAGLIVVNTNPLYTPREMEHQFKDSVKIRIGFIYIFALEVIY
jgi:long-chain acyl-CoA synthetase